MPHSFGSVADPKCPDYYKLRLEDERLPTRFFTDFVCRATQWLAREGGYATPASLIIPRARSAIAA